MKAKSGIYKNTNNDTVSIIYGGKIGMFTWTNEDNSATLGIYQLKGDYQIGEDYTDKEKINLDDAHLEMTFGNIKSINIVREALDNIEKRLTKLNDNIEKEVINTIAEVLECDKNDITTDTNLFDDLGADSLDATEIMMKLEKVFNIRIKDEEVLYKTEYEKIGNICSYIREQLDKENEKKNN